MPDGGSPFHRGERALQSRLGAREKMERLGRKVIRDRLTEEDRAFFAELPFIVVAALDDAGRPWASLLAGRPGFAEARDGRTLEVSARAARGDPLDEALIEGAEVGILGIELHSRRHHRVNGKVTAKTEGGFALGVAQSFANCPKYIQARECRLGDEFAKIGRQTLVRRGKALDREEAALVARADTFFIASQFSEDAEDWTHGVDVSHRGGRPGFVVVAYESALLFPDYRGNCMFNTLGNIWENPRCGLSFVDFESGEVVQVTGEADIIWGPERASEFPGAERVVSFRIEETTRIAGALPLVCKFEGYSPVFDDFEPRLGGEETAAAPPAMRLKSVNVSMPKEVAHKAKTVRSGIFKEPVAGRVMLRRLNLEGDGQADLWGHGGSFRAVLAYSVENYAYWARELGRDDFVMGQFGENFTVEGMPEDEVHVGDVFRIGGALFEVSQPRIPCYKLAMKMGIEGFENRFLASGRVGFYFRVLEEGEVGAGDDIRRVHTDPGRMTVRAVSEILFFDKENLDATRKALSIQALSHGWKGSFEERLARGFRAFTLDRKVVESESITSFYLVPRDGAPLPSFKPGQFLTFEINVPGHGEPLIRTYSLSERHNPDYYRVSIKREPAPTGPGDQAPGLSSNYLHDRVEVGGTLCVKAPRGKFCLDSESERPVVLLSAGVGLTPMISMLNTLVETSPQRRAWYIHGARNGREVAMGAAVRALAAEHPNVRVHIRFSRPDAADVEGRDYDSAGRVDVGLLKQVLPFDEYEFYLCGPPAFMKSLYGGLRSLGIAQARLHCEFFGPASVLGEVAATSTPAAAASPGGVEVTFARSGVKAAWDPAFANLLDFAEAHGLRPDFSCRSGICNTCRCEIEAGEVVYLEEPLDVPDPPHALICCATPKTDVVIAI